MRLLLCIVLVLFLSLCEVHGQATTTCTAPCTKSQLLNDVQTQFPDNTVGAITPSILRNFQNNMINSMMATSPVGAAAYACYVGTTGLPGTCTAALGIALGGTGATTQPAAASAIFPPPTRVGDIMYWNGSSWGTLAGNNTTTGILQQTNTGVPSWVSGNAVTPLVFPTPTRSGDVVYWNGTAWLTLPGNNSGSQVLTENSTGAPSWTTPGTVTSVIAGTGLSGGTITSTGTVAVNLSVFTNSIPADITINTTSYFDGPIVAQGTSGTWLASGVVTLTPGAATPRTFNVKLWDGSTVLSSTSLSVTNGSFGSVTLSGYIASPAGNIRMSVQQLNSDGIIKFNSSGSSKDSTITVFRIQ